MFIGPKISNFRNIITTSDFRMWLTSNSEDQLLVIQLDNLPEHRNLDFNVEYSTNVGSVIDYDIGQIDKENMKKSFRDFSNSGK